MAGERTLLILRHAKSSWKSPADDDHDRPLAPRGRRAAAAMAEHLTQLPHRPASVLCSSARRSVETLELVRRALGDPPTRVERGLYLASAAELLARVREVDDADGCILLIGHNPGLAELVGALAGAGDARATRRMRAKFPTAALAVLRFPAPHWRDVEPGAGTLLELTVPKDLV